MIWGYSSSVAGADGGRRLIDRLHALGVGHHDQAKGGELAVGAIGHGGVDAGGLLGRGLLGGGGVAAGENEKLVGGELEAVGILEAGQRRRALDELGRTGELHLAAAGDPLAEVFHGLEIFVSATSLRTAMAQVLLAGAGCSQTMWLAMSSSLAFS